MLDGVGREELPLVGFEDDEAPKRIAMRESLGSVISSGPPILFSEILYSVDRLVFQYST